MNKTDKIIFGSILGAFFPFLFSLIVFGIGFYVSEEHDMPYFFAAGLIAGYYFGRRITVKNIISPERELLIKKISAFSAFIMLVICISSAFLTLRERTIGEELQGMLGLNFVPRKGLIITGILTGGVLLIFAQYIITRITLIKTMNRGWCIF
jgi:hypothetical protein